MKKLKADFDTYYKLYLASIDAREILAECIEQLKSELEQSMKLPYPIGTPIYFAYSKQGVIKDEIRRWQTNNKGLMFCAKGSVFLPDAIGKSIFLTRKEAEQSLKGKAED